MAYVATDITPDASLLAIADLLAGEVDRAIVRFGDNTETYDTTLSDAGVTGVATPAPGGTMTFATLDAGMEPEGTITLLPGVSVIEVISPANNDTVTVGGTALTAKNPATGGSNTFDVSAGNNTTSAGNLAAAINALSVSTFGGKIFARHTTADGNRVTVSVLDQYDLPAYTLATSSAAHFVLSAATFGGTHERVGYRSFSGSVITVNERGKDNTCPSAHPNGCPVVLPASIDRLAGQISEVVNGDGVTEFGLGAAYVQAVIDLNPLIQQQTVELNQAVFLRDFGHPYLQDLDRHLLHSNDFLTTQPSFLVDSTGALISGATYPINGLYEYLRYKNDRSSGTAFSLLVPDDFAYLYWLDHGGVPLDRKTVFPDRTQFLQYQQGAGWNATTANLVRYGATDPTIVTRTQGYAAQRMRARVLVAGSGNATAISFKAQGMHASGVDFGRPRTLKITCGNSPTGVTNLPQVGDTVAIKNITFDAIAGAGSTVHFQIGATNAATAANLAAAINGVAPAWGVTTGAYVLLAGLVASVPDGTADVLLTPNALDTANHGVVSSVAARLALVVGTKVYADAIAIAAFGGGAGYAQIGLGSDSDVLSVSADDDPVLFTNNGVNLSLAAVGNVVDLQNPSATGDRCLYILPGTQAITTAGTGGGEVICVESYPERWIV